MVFLLRFSQSTYLKKDCGSYLEKQMTVVRIKEERQNDFDL